MVSQFDELSLDGRPVTTVTPYYVMLNKPEGIVSATKDDKFTTVIDLIPKSICPQPETLHYAGRLDRASTGLMLLTNDGVWSRALSDPAQKVSKGYRVTVQKPLKASDIEAFAKGFYFETEGVWTLPAELKILAEFEAEVTLFDGRYHQIKRMFGRCGNRVLALHRYRIGEIVLDPELKVGQSRALTPLEIASIAC